jgi:hypothetical protein
MLAPTPDTKLLLSASHPNATISDTKTAILHLVQPLNLVDFADGLIFSSAPRQGFLPPPCTCSVNVVSSELNEAVLPVSVRKHSKEELIAFFRDIQTSIAETSTKASRRTRKPSPDLFEKVDKRTQPYGML